MANFALPEDVSFDSDKEQKFSLPDDVSFSLPDDVSFDTPAIAEPEDPYAANVRKAEQMRKGQWVDYQSGDEATTLSSLHKGVRNVVTSKDAYDVASTLSDISEIDQRAAQEERLRKLKTGESPMMGERQAGAVFESDLESQKQAIAEAQKGYEAQLPADQEQRVQLVKDLEKEWEEFKFSSDYAQSIPTHETVKAITEADTFGGAVDAFLDAPVSSVWYLTMESLPAMAPGIAAGAINPVLGGIVMAGTSGFVEAGGTMAEHIAEVSQGAVSPEKVKEVGAWLDSKGIELGDVDGMSKLLSDPDAMAEAERQGFTKGAIVGLFDGLSIVSAGRLASSKLGQAGESLLLQPIYGMAGEAGGQIATEDDITAPGAIVAEGIGELSSIVTDAPVYYQAGKEVKDKVASKTKGHANDAEAAAVGANGEALSDKVVTVTSQNATTPVDLESPAEAEIAAPPEAIPVEEFKKQAAAEQAAAAPAQEGATPTEQAPQQQAPDTNVVPDSNETVLKELQLLDDPAQDRKAVLMTEEQANTMLTEEHEAIPLPDGRVLVVRKDQFNELTPQLAEMQQAYVKGDQDTVQTILGRLLNIGDGKPAPGQQAPVVQVRGEDGTVVQEGLETGSGAATAMAQDVAAKMPENATVNVTTPEAAVAERVESPVLQESATLLQYTIDEYNAIKNEATGGRKQIGTKEQVQAADNLWLGMRDLANRLHRQGYDVTDLVTALKKAAGITNKGRGEDLGLYASKIKQRGTSPIGGRRPKFMAGKGKNIPTGGWKLEEFFAEVNAALAKMDRTGPTLAPTEVGGLGKGAKGKKATEKSKQREAKKAEPTTPEIDPMDIPNEYGITPRQEAETLAKREAEEKAKRDAEDAEKAQRVQEAADEALQVAEQQKQKAAPVITKKGEKGKKAIEKSQERTPAVSPEFGSIAAEKFAAENDIIASDVTGTGKDGKITKADLQNHIKKLEKEAYAAEQADQERREVEKMQREAMGGEPERAGEKKKKGEDKGETVKVGREQEAHLADQGYDVSEIDEVQTQTREQADYTTPDDVLAEEAAMKRDAAIELAKELAAKRAEEAAKEAEAQVGKKTQSAADVVVADKRAARKAMLEKAKAKSQAKDTAKKEGKVSLKPKKETKKAEFIPGLEGIAVEGAIPPGRTPSTNVQIIAPKVMGISDVDYDGDVRNFPYTSRDAVVSPANTKGYMQGGGGNVGRGNIDQAYYDWFGPQIQERVQAKIKELYGSDTMPMGQSFMIRTYPEGQSIPMGYPGWLIVTPNNAYQTSGMPPKFTLDSSAKGVGSSYAVAMAGGVDRVFIPNFGGGSHVKSKQDTPQQTRKAFNDAIDKAIDTVEAMPRGRTMADRTKEPKPLTKEQQALVNELLKAGDLSREGAEAIVRLREERSPTNRVKNSRSSSRGIGANARTGKARWRDSSPEATVQARDELAADIAGTLDIAGNMSANEILEMVSEGTQDGDVYGVLADMLLEKGLNDVDVRLISNEEMADKANGYAGGLYEELPNGQRVVYINEDVLESGYGVKVLMHELVHAVTAANLTTDNKLARDLEKIRQQVVDQLGQDSHYGLTNLDEFVAEVMTNPEFQRALNDIQVEGGSKTLWRKFLDAVANFLGVDVKQGSALDAALSLAPDLMVNDKQARELLSQKKSYISDQVQATESDTASWMMGDRQGAEADIERVKNEVNNFVQEIKAEYPNENFVFLFHGTSKQSVHDVVDDPAMKPTQYGLSGFFTAPELDNAVDWASNKFGKHNVGVGVWAFTEAEYEQMVRTGKIKNGTMSFADNIHNYAETERTFRETVLTEFAVRKQYDSRSFADRNSPSRQFADRTTNKISKLGEMIKTDLIKGKSNLKESARGAHKTSLIFSTLDQIVRKYKDGIKSLKTYDSIMRRKNHIAREQQRKAEEINKAWAKLDGANEIKLAQLQQNATLQEVHADLAFYNKQNAHLWKGKSAKIIARNQKRHAALKQQFNDLSPDARAIYRKSRDFYANQRKDMQQATVEHIARKNKLDQLLTKQQYNNLLNAKTVQDVEAINLSILLDRADEVTNALKSVVKATSVKGPYFPLRRFGDYVVEGTKVYRSGPYATRQAAYDESNKYKYADPTNKSKAVKDEKTGKWYVEKTERYVEMFETEAEAKTRAAEMKAQGMGDVYPTKKADWKAPPGSGAAAVLVQAKGKFAEDSPLQSALDTAFLEMLLENSMRKSELQRKKVKGATLDMRRAFAERALAGSWAMADVKTALDHADVLKAMEQEARKGKDKAVRLGEVVQEIQARDNASVADRKISTLDQKASKFGFLWYLFSPSYAVVNATQVPLVAAPYLAAKYGAGATVELTKAYDGILGTAMKGLNKKAWGFKGAPDDLLNDIIDAMGGKNSDVGALINSLADEGIMDATFMQELYEATKGTREKGLVKQGMDLTMDLARSFPQAVELMNRAVVARATFNLEMKKSGDKAKANEAAREAVLETQFDYSDLNKPRAFKAAPGVRTVMMFKMFAQGMYVLITKNFMNAFSGDRKAEAAKTVLGLLSAHTMLAGVSGGLLIEPIRFALWALYNAWGDDDEDIDLDAVLRDFFTDMLGAYSAEIIMRGLPRAVGVDLSGRVGLNNMAFMGQQDARSYEEAWKNSVVAALGPVGAAGGNMMRGLDYINKGQYDKAMEAFMPKLIKDMFKAKRFATEGVTDYSGAKIMEETGIAATITQGIGFTPAQVAEGYEARTRQKRTETRIRDKGKILRQRFVNAITKDNFDRQDALIQEIYEYNSKYPEFAIDADSLINGVNDRYQREAMAEQGMWTEKGSIMELGESYNIQR
jgi:hypothetical protein